MQNFWNRMMNGKKKRRQYCILAFWIAVWFVLAAAVDNRILLATPLETFWALISRLSKGSFYLAAGRSLLRIGTGFLAGFAAALLLAMGSRRFPLLEDVLAPVLNLMKAIPVASFVVLLLIWWGSSFLSVAICFLVVLPNVYISTLEGLKSTDWRLLEMAEVFRLTFWSRFFYIYRPALKPFLYSSLKISLGMCWKSGIAAEVIGTPDNSIGEQMYLAKIYLDTAGVFAWTAVIVLLSVLFEKVFLRLTEVFFAWEPVCKGQMPYGGRSRGKGRSGLQEEAEEVGGTVRKAEEAEEGGGAVRKAEEAEEGGGIVRKAEKAEAVGGSVRKAEKAEAVGGAVGTAERAAGYIRCEDIDKSYHGERILEKVSVVYEPGQTYYLTSPSGSGKTTLLRILAGLTMLDAGCVKASFSCSMVFQEDRLCEDYSAVKNVALITGEGRRAEEALRKLLKEEALHKPCRQLSGGMKRRVALVRAMEAESEYILLDEPFTGMDAETKRRAEAYIREKQNGRTLIIATHR